MKIEIVKEEKLKVDEKEKLEKNILKTKVEDKNEN
mgnify:CR=1 FL=1